MKAIKNKIKENKNFIIFYNHQLLYWHTVEPSLNATSLQQPLFLADSPYFNSN